MFRIFTIARASAPVGAAVRRPSVKVSMANRRLKSTADIGGTTGNKGGGNSSSSAAPSSGSGGANPVGAKKDGAVPVGASLLAAVAGVAVVSGTAALVEYTTAASCLPYSANGQRYDQAAFAGRFSRMLLACDPRLLLYTEGQVRRAQEVLAAHGRDGTAAGGGGAVTDRTLWEARRITDAALHPDTGEVIPRPFRMSGYVPYNGPICVAMVASTSTAPLLFWSWANQSQNALVNYYVSEVQECMEEDPDGDAVACKRSKSHCIPT
jgi:hypothetical protein